MPENKYSKKLQLRQEKEIESKDLKFFLERLKNEIKDDFHMLN